MVSKITIVKGDFDWTALYVNDTLKLQAHSLDLEDALWVAAKIGHEFVISTYIDESNYLEEVDSYYPTSLKELIDHANA